MFEPDTFLRTNLPVKICSPKCLTTKCEIAVAIYCPYKNVRTWQRQNYVYKQVYMAKHFYYVYLEPSKFRISWNYANIKRYIFCKKGGIGLGGVDDHLKSTTITPHFATGSGKTFTLNICQAYFAICGTLSIQRESTTNI